MVIGSSVVSAPWNFETLELQPPIPYFHTSSHSGKHPLPARSASQATTKQKKCEGEVVYCL